MGLLQLERRAAIGTARGDLADERTIIAPAASKFRMALAGCKDVN